MDVDSGTDGCSVPEKWRFGILSQYVDDVPQPFWWLSRVRLYLGQHLYRVAEVVVGDELVGTFVDQIQLYQLHGEVDTHVIYAVLHALGQRHVVLGYVNQARPDQSVDRFEVVTVIFAAIGQQSRHQLVGPLLAEDAGILEGLQNSDNDLLEAHDDGVVAQRRNEGVL